MSTFDSKALWGWEIVSPGPLDESFLPSGDRPFESAVLAAQSSYPALCLQAVLAQVLVGDRHDGAGDIYCPAFERGTDAISVVQWHHDEYLAWGKAASSFSQLDAMLSILEELQDADDADAEEIRDLFYEAEDRDARLEAVEDDELRGILAKWPPVDPPPSYDFGEWNEPLEMLAVEGGDTSEGAALLARAHDRLKRAGWLVQALCGHAVSAPEDARIDRALAAVMDHPQAAQPADVIQAMWSAWLTGQDQHARSLVETFSSSPSALVADAARLVNAALDGETKIGSADLEPVREALTKRRSEDQRLAGGKARVRSLDVPNRNEWAENLLTYPGLETFVSSIQAMPPEIARLAKLRRLEFRGAAPPAIAQLANLEVLHCQSLPNDLGTLPNLRELRLSYCATDPLPVIQRQRGLTSVYFVTGVGIDTKDLGPLEKLRHLDFVSSDKDETRFAPELAALPSLETIVFRGKLGPLPPDWSRAVSLREVRLMGILPHDYRALASAPNLERLVVEPYTEAMPTPQLDGLSGLKSLTIAGMLADDAATGRALAELGCTHHVRFKAQMGALPDLSGLDVEHFEAYVADAKAWPTLASLLRSMSRLRALTLHTIGVAKEPVDQSPWPKLRELRLQQAANVSPLIATVGDAPSLETLVLGDGEAGWIPEVDRGAWLDGLVSCADLKVAELAGTKLRAEDVAALARLPKLTRLVARKCGITSLPAGLAAVEMLDLRDNPLTALASMPPHLVTLRLGGTQVGSLDGIAPPKQLEHLDLASPALERVPSWLGELSALRSLELSGPKLDLEHALEIAATLPALRSLTIRNVKQPRIPPTLMTMTSLERLHLIASNYSEPLKVLRPALPDTAIVME